MRKRALFEKSRSYSGSMDRPLQIVTEPTDVVAGKVQCSVLRLLEWDQRLTQIRHGTLNLFDII